MNDSLLFMLRPIYSSVCIIYSSSVFCVNADELMFVSCFILCDSSYITKIVMAEPRHSAPLLPKPTTDTVWSQFHHFLSSQSALLTTTSMFLSIFCIAESCMTHLLEWSNCKAREYLGPIFELVSMGQSLEI